MSLITLARQLVRRTGFDVHRHRPLTHPAVRRQMLLSRLGIQRVFDIGANAGQYGQELRRHGYSSYIMSFEPTSGAFARLQQAVAADRYQPEPASVSSIPPLPLPTGCRWAAERLAIGTRKGPSTVHVAENSVSSSLLPMLPAHEAAAPGSAYVGTEEVPTLTLDAAGARFWTQLTPPPTYVKIDTQGSEADVLDSGPTVLSYARGLEVEMSLVPLYDGAPVYDELYDRLVTLGFSLVSIEPEFIDPVTGRVLQVNGIFARE